MSKSKQQQKPSKNTKNKLKQIIKTEPMHPIIQFNPYHKHFSQHLDSVIMCLRRLTTLENTYYREYQKVSKDIQTSFKINLNHKLKCLELIINLSQLDQHYLTFFKNKLVTLIIQHCELLLSNSTITILQKYFKIQVKIINQIDLKFLLSKLAKYPSNQIIWTIINQIIQSTDQYSENNIPQFTSKFIQHIHSYQIPQFADLGTILKFYEKLIDFLLEKSILSQFPLFQISLFSLSGYNTQLFRDILSYSFSNCSQNNSKKIIFLSKLFICFDSQNKKYKDFQKFCVLINFHQTFQKVIKFKLEQNQFPDQITTNHLKLLFQLLQFCDFIKNSNRIESIIKILPKYQLKIQHLNQWNFSYCSSILYNLTFETQKILSKYQLKFYSDFYIENPGIFQQSFFQNLIQSCQQLERVQLVIKLVQKWVLNNQLRNFSLINFIYKYIEFSMKGNQQQIIRFINGISFINLQMLSMLIYKQSFETRPQRKSNVPKTLSSLERFSQLSSCGYVDDNIFVDRYYYRIKQLLVWKPIINQFEKRDKYFLTKYFYYSIHQVFIKDNQRRKNLLSLLVNKIELSIKSQLQIICSNLHLILVVSANNQDREIKKNLLQIIIQNIQHLMNLYESIYTQRTKCQKYMQLSEQDVKNNRKNLQRCKKMNKVMMKNLIRFFDDCGAQIVDIIPKTQSLQQFINIVNQLSKEGQIQPHSIIRKVSAKCSRNKFINSALERIQFNNLITNDYYVYRQIIYTQSQSKKNQQYLEVKDINPQKILNLSLNVLEKEITISLQRQQLKSKLISLQILKTMKILCENRFFPKFKQFYLSKMNQIKLLVLRLMYKDYKILGKYQRQLILHIRCFILVWMMQQYKTNYSIINQQDIWCLFIHLCIDQCLQIRVLLVNSFFSRYKQSFKRLRYQLHWCLAVSFIMQIYDPIGKIKQLCKTINSSFQNNIQVSCLVGIILSFISYNFNSLIPSQSILEQYCKYWFKNKQTQFSFYSLVQELEVRKVMISQYQFNKFNSQITSYYISRLGSQFKITLNLEDSSSIYSFIKQLIRQKPRTMKTLKGKKQLFVDWNNIKSLGIITDNKASIFH